MAPKIELLTVAEFAERWGVDERTARNYLVEGMPQRKISGRVRIAWPDGRDWAKEKIRADGRALRHAAGDEERALQLADLKVELARAEVEEVRINLTLKRGSAIPREYMRA